MCVRTCTRRHARATPIQRSLHFVLTFELPTVWCCPRGSGGQVVRCQLWVSYCPFRTLSSTSSRSSQVWASIHASLPQLHFPLLRLLFQGYQYLFQCPILFSTTLFCRISALSLLSFSSCSNKAPSKTFSGH